MERNRKFRKIAVTGKAGTGKTTISRYIASYGYKLIEADKIAHDLLRKADIKNSVISTFGKVLLKNDEIIRNNLAEIVFSDIEQRNKLNSILHPPMLTLINEYLDKFEYLILEAAILNLWDIDNKFDLIICMTSSEEVIRYRLKNKGWENNSIDRIIKIQENICNNPKYVKIENNYSDLKKIYQKIDESLNKGK